MSTEQQNNPNIKDTNKTHYVAYSTSTAEQHVYSKTDQGEFSKSNIINKEVFNK